MLTSSFTPDDATRIQSLFIIPKQSRLNESIGCSGFTFTVSLGGRIMGINNSTSVIVLLFYFLLDVFNFLNELGNLGVGIGAVSIDQSSLSVVVCFDQVQDGVIHWI